MTRPYFIDKPIWFIIRLFAIGYCLMAIAVDTFHFGKTGKWNLVWWTLGVQAIWKTYVLFKHFGRFPILVACLALMIDFILAPINQMIIILTVAFEDSPSTNFTATTESLLPLMNATQIEKVNGMHKHISIYTLSVIFLFEAVVAVIFFRWYKRMDDDLSRTIKEWLHIPLHTKQETINEMVFQHIPIESVEKIRIKTDTDKTDGGPKYSKIGYNYDPIFFVGTFQCFLIFINMKNALNDTQ